MSLRPLSYPELGRAGRLGNQLFEIASTVGLARRNRMRPLFPADWEYREFFSCPDSWFGLPQPRMAHPTAYARHLDRRCRGYLQDLSLWEGSEDEIRRAFALSSAAQAVVDEEWDQHFASLRSPVCSVHVRRGDYATNPIGTLTTLPADYYIEALTILQPASIVVFSDDLGWCKRNIPADVFYPGVARPVEHAQDYRTAPVLDWVDLGLQERCDLHIISNSTYSWWGAWLGNKNPQRDVLYPSRWYGDELSSYIDFKLMIPPGWWEIPVRE